VKKKAKINNWKQNFLHHRIISAIQRVEFAGDRVSYRVLTGRRLTSLLWIHMHQLRRKATIKRTVFFCGNESRFEIIFLITILKFC